MIKNQLKTNYDKKKKIILTFEEIIKNQQNKQIELFNFKLAIMKFHLFKCAYLVPTTSIPVASAPDHLSEHLKVHEEHTRMERAHS